jgi:ketosteroid isomerase-like protein
MEDEILATAHAFAAALAGGDAEGAALYYADEAKLLTSAAEVIAGRREIHAYWRAGLSLGLSGVELEPSTLERRGRLAVEIGRYRLAFDDAGGGASNDSGKYLVLHRREPGGAWRRAVDVFNPDVPKPARPKAKGGL